MDKNEYVERAKVLKVWKSSDEADVLLKVKGFELECFLGTTLVDNPFEEGEECLVKLSFMTYPKIINNSAKKTEIKQIDGLRIQPSHVNQYSLSGKIISVEDHPRYSFAYNVILDCGLKIPVQIQKNQNPRVGDFITVEGRLDVIRIKGVNEK